MKQVKSFVKNSLNGIVLSVWTVFFCAIFLLWFNDSPSLKVCAVMGAVGFIGTIVLARLLTLGVNTEKKKDRLSWYIYLAALVMALTIHLTAGDLKGIFIGTLCGWLLCSVSGIFVVNRYSKLNIELEDLRRSDTAEYIRKMVKVGRMLAEEYEETMLHLPDALRLAAKYINYSRFYRSVENKFIQDRRFAGLWKEYFKQYSLLDSQEMELFEREDAKEVVGAYSAGSQLCERGELKLFSMPNAKEWVKMYIENGPFGSVRVEKKLFETPEYKELADYYKSRYALYDDTYRMLQTAYQY